MNKTKGNLINKLTLKNKDMLTKSGERKSDVIYIHEGILVLSHNDSLKHLKVIKFYRMN